MIKKIIIGSDHAGTAIKEKIKIFLNGLSYEIEDVGCYSTLSVDYPDIVAKAVKIFQANLKSNQPSATFNNPLSRHFNHLFGILICGTGIGVSITANKFKGIFCALIYDLQTAKMAKAHNHVNFIALGARVNYKDKIEDIIKTFLNTSYETGRHVKRVNKIKLIEENKYGNQTKP